MVSLDEVPDTDRQWSIHSSNPQKLSPQHTLDPTCMISLRSRRVPETFEMPPVCISTHKYKITPVLPACCLQEPYPQCIHIHLSLRYASPSSLEEVADFKYPDCRNGIRGAAWLDLPLEPSGGNVYRTTERYQFTALSYSHKNRAFVLQISFHLEKNSESEPIFTMVSAPFKVLSQRSRKLQNPTPNQRRVKDASGNTKVKKSKSKTATKGTVQTEGELRSKLFVPVCLPAAVDAVIEQETSMPLTWVAAVHHRLLTPTASPSVSPCPSPSPSAIPTELPFIEMNQDTVPPSPSSTTSAPSSSLSSSTSMTQLSGNVGTEDVGSDHTCSAALLSSLRYPPLITGKRPRDTGNEEQGESPRCKQRRVTVKQEESQICNDTEKLARSSLTANSDVSRQRMPPAFTLLHFY